MWFLNLAGKKSGEGGFRNAEISNLNSTFEKLQKIAPSSKSDCGRFMVVDFDQRYRSLAIELIREMAELLVYGEQNGKREFFAEKNLFAYFVACLGLEEAPVSIRVQLLQTISILLHNVRERTSLFFMLSNNHINTLLCTRFPILEPEIAAYFTALLKGLALRLDAETARFFLSNQGNWFPLFSESVRLAFHPDSMVRTGMQTILLKLMGAADQKIHSFILMRPRVFDYLACYLRRLWLKIDKIRYPAVPHKESLDSIDDYILFLEDLLSLGSPSVSRLLVDRLLRYTFLPLLTGTILRTPLVVSAVRPILSPYSSGQSLAQSPTFAATGDALDFICSLSRHPQRSQSSSSSSLGTPDSYFSSNSCPPLATPLGPDASPLAVSSVVDQSLTAYKLSSVRTALYLANRVLAISTSPILQRCIIDCMLASQIPSSWVRTAMHPPPLPTFFTTLQGDTSSLAGKSHLLLPFEDDPLAGPPREEPPPLDGALAERFYLPSDSQREERIPRSNHFTLLPTSYLDAINASGLLNWPEEVISCKLTGCADKSSSFVDNVARTRLIYWFAAANGAPFAEVFPGSLSDYRKIRSLLYDAQGTNCTTSLPIDPRAPMNAWWQVISCPPRQVSPQVLHGLPFVETAPLFDAGISLPAVSHTPPPSAAVTVASALLASTPIPLRADLLHNNNNNILNNTDEEVTTSLLAKGGECDPFVFNFIGFMLQVLKNQSSLHPDVLSSIGLSPSLTAPRSSSETLPIASPSGTNETANTIPVPLPSILAATSRGAKPVSSLITSANLIMLVLASLPHLHKFRPITVRAMLTLLIEILETPICVKSECSGSRLLEFVRAHSIWSLSDTARRLLLLAKAPGSDMFIACYNIAFALAHRLPGSLSFKSPPHAFTLASQRCESWVLDATLNYEFALSRVGETANEMLDLSPLYFIDEPGSFTLASNFVSGARIVRATNLNDLEALSGSQYHRSGTSNSAIASRTAQSTVDLVFWNATSSGLSVGGGGPACAHALPNSWFAVGICANFSMIMLERFAKAVREGFLETATGMTKLMNKTVPPALKSTVLRAKWAKLNIPMLPSVIASADATISTRISAKELILRGYPDLALWEYNLSSEDAARLISSNNNNDNNRISIPKSPVNIISIGSGIPIGNTHRVITYILPSVTVSPSSSTHGGNTTAALHLEPAPLGPSNSLAHPQGNSLPPGSGVHFVLLKNNTGSSSSGAESQKQLTSPSDLILGHFKPDHLQVNVGHLGPNPSQHPSAIKRYIVLHPELLLMVSPDVSNPSFAIVNLVISLRDVEMCFSKSDPRIATFFFRSSEKLPDASPFSILPPGVPLPSEIEKNQAKNGKIDGGNILCGARSTMDMNGLKSGALCELYQMTVAFDDVRRSLVVRTLIDHSKKSLREWELGTLEGVYRRCGGGLAASFNSQK